MKKIKIYFKILVPAELNINNKSYTTFEDADLDYFSGEMVYNSNHFSTEQEAIDFLESEHGKHLYFSEFVVQKIYNR